MADKTVGMLENVPSLHDESLIPVEQSGELMHATGKQFREFAEGAAERYVEDATGVAERAEAALGALDNEVAEAQRAAANAADSEKKAKLYADQTEAAAGGGVSSFNGRGGHVVPQAGDYTAADVGAVAYLDSSPGATLMEKVKNAYESGYNAAVIGLWENAPLEDAEGIQWGYAEYRKHATGFITVTIRNDVVLEPTKRRTIYIADWTWYGDWHKTATTADLDALTAADVGAVEASTHNVIVEGNIFEWALAQFNSVSIGVTSVVTGMPYDYAYWFVELRVAASAQWRFLTATRVSNGVATAEKYENAYVNDAWNGWTKLATTDTALMLDGSNAMTGALNFLDAANKVRLSEVVRHSDITVIRHWLDDNKQQYLALLIAPEHGGLLYQTPDGNNNILHTGNKPSGSYTGNGSSAAWTLNIGGIGELLLIRSAAASRDYIVGKYGAVCIGGSTPTTFSREEIRFESGTLTVATSSGAFNQNGSTYTYHRL